MFTGNSIIQRFDELKSDYGTKLAADIKNSRLKDKKDKTLTLGDVRDWVTWLFKNIRLSTRLEKNPMEFNQTEGAQKEFEIYFSLIKELDSANLLSEDVLTRKLASVIQRDDPDQWGAFVKVLSMMRQKKGIFGFIVDGYSRHSSYKRNWTLIHQFLMLVMAPCEDKSKKALELDIEDCDLFAYLHNPDKTAAFAEVYRQLYEKGILNTQIRNILIYHAEKLRGDLSGIGKLLLELHNKKLLEDPEILKNLKEHNLETLNRIYAVCSIADAKSDLVTHLLKQLIRVTRDDQFTLSPFSVILSKLDQKKLLTIENANRLFLCWGKARYDGIISQVDAVKDQTQLNALLFKYIVDEELCLLRYTPGDMQAEELQKYLSKAKQNCPADYEAIVNQCLHTIIVSKNPKLIQILLEEKADIHHRQWNGETIWHEIAYSGTPEIAVLLLQKEAKGAEVFKSRDALGRTPLHMAAANDAAMPMIKFLLTQPLDISAQDEKGHTILHKLSSLRDISMEDADFIVKTVLEKDKSTAQLKSNEKDVKLTPFSCALLVEHPNFFVAAALLKANVVSKEELQAVIQTLKKPNSPSQLTMLLCLRYAFPKRLGDKLLHELDEYFCEPNIASAAATDLVLKNLDYYFDLSMRMRFKKDLLLPKEAAAKLALFNPSLGCVGECDYETPHSLVAAVFLHRPLLPDESKAANALLSLLPGSHLPVVDQVWSDLRLKCSNFIVRDVWRETLNFLMDKQPTMQERDLYVDGHKGKEQDQAMVNGFAKRSTAISDTSKMMNKKLAGKAEKFKLQTFDYLEAKEKSSLIDMWNTMTDYKSNVKETGPLVFYFMHIIVALNNSQINRAIETAIACLINHPNSKIQNMLIEFLQLGDAPPCKRPNGLFDWANIQAAYRIGKITENLCHETKKFFDVFANNKGFRELFFGLLKEVPDAVVLPRTPLDKAPIRRLTAPGHNGVFQVPAANGAQNGASLGSNNTPQPK